MSRWPETFGGLAAEHAAAHRKGGFAVGVSSLTWAVGPDAVTYLQGVISQDIASLAPGRVARSFLLQPRGKLEAILWVLRDEHRVGLVTDAGRMSETIQALSRWRLRVDVEFEPDPRQMFDVWGPASAGLDTGDGWRDAGGILAAEVARSPLRHRLVAGVDPGVLQSQGLRPLGQQVATALRIEVGEPRMGVDVDGRTIPQESGLVPEAVSFTKGCFLGQELVARIDSRGRVNRNLRGVRMLEPVLPPVGARVFHAGGKLVGALTSVAHSPAVDAPVGLALIRREAPPGTEVTVSWGTKTVRAVIEQLPLVAGVAAN